MTISAQILAFLQNLGWPEMLVIGVIALLIFGKRLPEVGRSLGKGIVEFKKGLRETGDDLKKGIDETPVPPGNRGSQTIPPEKPNSSQNNS
ncbi:MAG TPA: twin-arginine translocase TatA/TatE family subunit [Phycisphaerae bacterium]|nr:twin-arginine translocase TatA/TatE family subunit [Phycisphaerae bacterium]